MCARARTNELFRWGRGGGGAASELLTRMVLIFYCIYLGVILKALFKRKVAIDEIK